MEKVIKTFISEIKSVNEKDFTLEAVVSDETVDRYGEVIKIDAWKKRLGRYKAQPVLLSSHRYDKLTNQIGKAEKIRVEDGKLVAKFKYFHGEGNEEADWAWKLASKFGMAAYSVGFLPYKAEDKEYDEDVKAGKKAWREYTDVELLEVSQVLVPANPSAMMKSFEDEEDEVLKNYIEMVHKEFTPQSEEFVEMISEDLEVRDVEEDIEVKEEENIEIKSEEEIEEIISPEEDKKKPCGPKGKVFEIEEAEMSEILERLVSLETKVDSIVERYAKIDEEDVEFNKMLEEDEQKEIDEAKIEEENYIKSLLEDSLASINKAVSSVQQK